REAPLSRHADCMKSIPASGQGPWPDPKQPTRRCAMHHIVDSIKVINSLLRGELSATETYQQALAKVGKEPGAAELRQIHDEHRSAANALRQEVHRLGGKPDQD